MPPGKQSSPRPSHQYEILGEREKLSDHSAKSAKPIAAAKSNKTRRMKGK
jgi:hypothetical protein